jgi:hypothetical protein
MSTLKSSATINVRRQWEEEYFCPQVQSNIIYLICSRMLGICKVYMLNVIRKHHTEKYDMLQESLDLTVYELRLY